jgi:hypothetical protein
LKKQTFFTSLFTFMTSDADDAQRPASASDPVAPTESAAAAHVSGSPIAPGQRWHAYQVGDAVPCDHGWTFHAVNVGMLEDVRLYVRPVGDVNPARGEAWQKLQNGKYPGLLQVSEALEENGFRFETSEVPPPATLREWADTHQASLDDVEGLLRQLAATVQAIHLVGVVHCNLTLDTIHLVDADAGLKVLIGGLDRATLYEQPGLIDLPVNPLYAPPEAAGLTKHRAGPGLRAWDWWSLGRIMQELVLGQPVVGLVLGRDVSRITPEIKARAEELLLERDAAGAKAGAVEKMPAMSDDLASLLRGLLSSCRDGRWGWRELQGWLKREAVPDRYELTRNDRLFLWKDRAFTVAEAAEFFSAEPEWAAGVEQIFDTKNPASFIAFTHREQELAPVAEQLDSLRDFMQLPAWREFPVEVVRTVIASASWLQIGEERRSLLLRGKRVDSALLRSLVQTEPLAEGLALVRAILAPPFIQLITSRDPETARVLSVVSANATEVMTVSQNNEWLSPADTAGFARLLSCVLEGDGDLLRHREELKKRFALTRHPLLETIFKAPKAKHKELILLAFAAGEPERAGFVTHLDWNRDRYMVLRERGERLAAKLFWLRLERVLKSSPFILGSWSWAIAFCAALTVALALSAPPPWGIFSGLALASLLLGLRVAVFASQAGAALRYSQNHTPWTLQSGAGRCREEARAVLPGEPLQKPAKVSSELLEINREITALKLEPAPEAIHRPPGLAMSWTGSGAGWLIVAAVLGWTSWSGSPSNATALNPVDAGTDYATDPTHTPHEKKIVLTPEERFFSDPRSAYVSWDFPEPDHAPALPVSGYAIPTPEQVAMALIDGQKLLAPYAPHTASGVIAVPVAAGLRHPGVMLYDVKRRNLVERRIFTLDQLPDADRSWHELDHRKILYLGEPPALSLEMWADEPLASVGKTGGSTDESKPPSEPVPAVADANEATAEQK